MDLDAETRMTMPIALPFSWSDLPRQACQPGGYRAISKGSEWTTTLSDGRGIRLSSLRQYLTYGGVLAGLPLDDMARAMPIERAVSLSMETFSLQASDICILPPRMMSSRVTRMPRGAREIRVVDFLPPVCSIAEFTSSIPVSDTDAMGSDAVVVWFQSSFGPPEDGHVTDQLRMVEWMRFGKDWGW
jgi:hypothetical protein